MLRRPGGHSLVLALAVAMLGALACSSRTQTAGDDQAAGSAAQPPPSLPPPTPVPADAAAALTWYRVEATVSARGVVPFLLGVDPVRPEAWILSSAAERLPVTVVSRTPLVLRIPVRGVELQLSPDGTTGQLRGSWRVTYYFKRDFDVIAVPVAAPTPAALFPGSAPAAVDLAGSWRFDIHEFGVGRAVFRQASDGAIEGTVIPPEIGDLRHLSGRVIGHTARLSAFDGIHGFLLEMAQGADGRLSGRWLIAGIGEYPFTATREPAPATHVRVGAHLAPGKRRVTVPELEQPPYRGNPVIIDYFGTWCPVCIDLTPELVRLHREHRAAGLQILSIALEPEGDPVEIQRRLDEFRAAFAIPWPFVLKVGDDFLAALPPELKNATGFPVTLFLDRDHVVTAIHTGFVSRAAGPEHAEVVALFDRYTAAIAAPAAPASP